MTKEVVEYAHAHGVVVEAELGKLAGVEDNIKVDARSATFTDPDEAAEFVERTGVDSLAIAIGTSHGAYKFKGEPYLDFDRLRAIHKLIPDTRLYFTALPPFSKNSWISAICTAATSRSSGRSGRNDKGSSQIWYMQGQHRHRPSSCHDRRSAQVPGGKSCRIRPKKISWSGQRCHKIHGAHKIRNVLNCSGSMG